MKKLPKIKDSFTNLIYTTKKSFSKKAKVLTLAGLVAISSALSAQTPSTFFKKAADLDTQLTKAKTEYVMDQTQNKVDIETINSLRDKTEATIEKGIEALGNHISTVISSPDSVDVTTLKKNIDKELAVMDSVASAMKDVEFAKQQKTVHDQVDHLLDLRKQIQDNFHKVKKDLAMKHIDSGDIDIINKAFAISDEDEGLAKYAFLQFQDILKIIDHMTTPQLNHDDIKMVHLNLTAILNLLPVKDVQNPYHDAAIDDLKGEINSILKSMMAYTNNVTQHADTNFSIGQKPQAHFKDATEAYHMVASFKNYMGKDLVTKMNFTKDNVQKALLNAADRAAEGFSYDNSEDYLSIARSFMNTSTPEILKASKNIALLRIVEAEKLLSSDLDSLNRAEQTKIDGKTAIELLTETKKLHKNMKLEVNDAEKDIAKTLGKKIGILITQNSDSTYSDVWNLFEDVSKSKLSKENKKVIIKYAKDALKVQQESDAKKIIEEKIIKYEKKLTKKGLFSFLKR